MIWGSHPYDRPTRFGITKCRGFIPVVTLQVVKKLSATVLRLREHQLFDRNLQNRRAIGSGYHHGGA